MEAKGGKIGVCVFVYVFVRECVFVFVFVSECVFVYVCGCKGGCVN